MVVDVVCRGLDVPCADCTIILHVSRSSSVWEGQTIDDAVTALVSDVYKLLMSKHQIYLTFLPSSNQHQPPPADQYLAVPYRAVRKYNQSSSRPH